MFRRLLSFLKSLFRIRQNPARTFNGAGHMVVANLAYKKMKPETKMRVHQLLRLNPYFERWQKAIPADASQEERERRTFLFASMWADDIKRDKDYVSDRIDGGEQDVDSEISDYSDKRMHKYWHYVNYPFSTDGTELPPVVQPNLETAINDLRAVIASDATEGQKSYALTWLLHLIGDAHQPLHSTARVSQNEKGGDLGGNKVFVIVNGRNSRLHFFWDDILGVEKQAARINRLTREIPPDDSDLAAKLTVHDWLMESFDACQKLVYTDPIGEGSGPFTITEEYRSKGREFAKKRVSLAASRLASVLNRELK
jgi:hypothetical protein